MKLITTSLVLILCISTIYAQSNIKIEPYTFVSNANDTVQAELISFTVLEDRENSLKDSIRLSFVRFKSTNPNPSSPIVYLAGGPGGSGISTAKGNRFELFMQLREVADVIAFDQRGTGLSNSIHNCPYSSNFDIDRPVEKVEYVKKSTETISKCLTFWQDQNVNLKAYNTLESANDIDDLRKVLGVEKISLWGISYGSHLAFEYIRRFEKHIDRVVLASLEGPDETIKYPRDTENFIFKIADLAADNYGAKPVYPNLKEKIHKVHERLKEKPIFTPFVNSFGKNDTLGISNFELSMAIATFYLKNPNDSKKLPNIYTKMYDGDFSSIIREIIIVKRFLFSRIRPMALAMDLQSGISEKRKQIVTEQIETSILGSSINFLLYEWMMKLGFQQLPDEFRVLKTNNVKSLLLSGTLDGRTYIGSAKKIAEKFRNGKHVIVENAGHDLFMASPEIGEIVLNFFNGKEPNKDRIVLDSYAFK